MRGALLALLLLASCRTTDPNTMPAPWGAADFCQRNPEHIRCLPPKS